MSKRSCEQADTNGSGRWNHRQLWPLGLMIVCGYDQISLGPQFELACWLAATHIELYPNWRARPQARPIGQAVREAGLRLWSVHSPWASHSIATRRVDFSHEEQAGRAAAVADVTESLHRAADASASGQLVHPGVLARPQQHAARRAPLHDSLAAIAQWAQRRAVTVCVENQPPGACPGAETAKRADLVQPLGALFASTPAMRTWLPGWRQNCALPPCLFASYSCTITTAGATHICHPELAHCPGRDSPQRWP